MKPLTKIVRSIRKWSKRRIEHRQGAYNEYLEKEPASHVYFSDELDEGGNICPTICIDGVKILRVCTANSVTESTVDITDAGAIMRIMRKNWIEAHKLNKV